MDTTPYFLNNVQKYANMDYQVSFRDYLNIRDQSTGVIPKEMYIHAGYNAYLLAMLGQIFVMSMSTGYTCLLFKNPKKIIYLKTPKKRIE